MAPHPRHALRALRRPLIQRGVRPRARSDTTRARRTGPASRARSLGRARRRAAMRPASPPLQHPSAPALRLIPPLITDGDRPSTLAMRASQPRLQPRTDHSPVPRAQRPTTTHTQPLSTRKIAYTP